MVTSEPVSVPPTAHGGTARRAQRRQQQRERAHKWAKGIIEKKAPHLLIDSNELSIFAREIEKLCAALAFKSSLEEVRWGYNYLAEILHKGAEERGWKVETYPPQIINLPRPTSPFRPDTFSRSSILSEIIRRHERALQDPSKFGVWSRNEADRTNTDGGRLRTPKPLSAVELKAAQLLFSAIVFGGLIERSLVYDLHDSLEKRLYNHEDLLWVDFLVHGDAEKAQIYRRWFPDPTTACLILRHRMAGSVWPCATPVVLRRLLGKYLSTLGVHFVRDSSAEQEARSRRTRMRVHFTGADAPVFESHATFTRQAVFEFLLDAAETRLQTLVPGVLVGFARSLRAGVSLPPGAWWRTLTDKRLRDTVNTGREPESGFHAGLLGRVEAWPSRPVLASPHAKPTLQTKLFAEVRRCFGKDNRYVQPAAARRALAQLLKDRRSEFGPMLLSIAAWADWCLADRTKGKGTLVAKSVRRYLTSIGKRLVQHAGHLDPRSLSPESFRSLFDQIANSISSYGERQYAFERLVEFHDYLVSALDIEPLESDPQGNSGAAKTTPDANLVSEQEFKATQDQIRYWVQDRRKQQMLLIIATLGFRLGLRRDEIMGLQLNSVHGVGPTSKVTSQPLMWVHATNFSSVKSNSSVRRLPLAVTLLDKELERLVNWVMRRYQEDGSSTTDNRLLFCERGEPTTKLGDAGNFELITQALRAVTGDPSMRFHHFRHSFITLLTAQLLAAAEPDWGNGALPQTWNVTTHLSGTALLRRMFEIEGPVRQAIFQVSALAGHLDPQVTTQTYCHSLDWLLGKYLAFTERPISLDLLAAIDGRSRSAVAVARHRHRMAARNLGLADIRLSVAHLIRQVRRTDPSRFARPPALVKRTKAPPPPQVPIRSRTLTDLTLDEAYALALSSVRPMSNKTRATLFEMAVPDVVSFLSTASKLSAVSTSTRAKAHRRARFLRHAHLRNQMPSIDRQPEIPGIGPALPKTANERREAREVFRKLMKAQRDEPKSVLEQLECLAHIGSRSSPGFHIARERDAGQLGALLKTIDIAARRIKVRTLSLPKDNPSKLDLRIRIDRCLGISKTSFAMDSKVGRSKNPIGSFLITVSVRSSATDHSHHQVAFGWKVACFYALAIMRVMTKSGYQMDLL